MTLITQSAEPVRRSTRIRAQIPLRLVSMDPAFPFSEQCYTIIINTEGCGVRLTQPLEPGLPVSLDELPSGKRATAQVANCVPLGTEGKYWLVGIALEEPGNVWCIRPAPVNWERASTVRAATTAPQAAPAKKAAQWPYSVFSSKGESHPGRK
jgi:hypothetical protein